jgi:hypothetical protein
MKSPVSESLTLLTAVPNLAFASGMLSRFAEHAIALACMASFGMG